MNKKSRGLAPGDRSPRPSEQAAAAGPPTSAAAPSSPSGTRGSTRRQERIRSQRRTADRGTPSRNILLAALAVVGVGIVAVFLLAGTSSARYVCETQLTPPPEAAVDPAASPDPGAEPGFPTTDLGRGHVPTGATVRYAFCPPTSGQHWSAAGRAPLRRDVYGPGDDVTPANWIHNLEHGYVVIAYRDELSTEERDGIRQVFETADQSPVAAQCGIPNKVLAAQLDEMDQPFALLAWDRALLLPEWDTERAMAFANRWQDSIQIPEPGVC